jgi:hypothetical protein
MSHDTIFCQNHINVIQSYERYCSGTLHARRDSCGHCCILQVAEYPFEACHWHRMLGFLANQVCLQHSNVCPQCVHATVDIIGNQELEIIPWPPYSLDPYQ